MKVKLYFENEKAIKKSGIGRALKHQKKALTINKIDFTTNHSNRDFDILHINTIYLASYLELKKAKNNNKKIVYHAHSTKEDFKNSFMFSNLIAPLYQIWLLNMYKKADSIITPTPYSKSLLEGYGLKQDIIAISNGIDTERFKKDLNKENRFEEYFNLSKDSKVIISVGWLFERKGFDTFCEVASRLPDYTFIWFGDKNLSFPSKKIRKWIKSLPDNVILPGYIDGDIIIGGYTRADLFFFPSREETEGIVVLEALSAKCKVLVRDIPVFNGWLKNKENCYMANNNDEFVDIIPKILEKELPDLSEAGFLVAQARNFDAIGKQINSVYCATLKGKKEDCETNC